MHYKYNIHYNYNILFYIGIKQKKLSINIVYILSVTINAHLYYTIKKVKLKSKNYIVVIYLIYVITALYI